MERRHRTELGLEVEIGEIDGLRGFLYLDRKLAFFILYRKALSPEDTMNTFLMVVERRAICECLSTFCIATFVWFQLQAVECMSGPRIH